MKKLMFALLLLVSFSANAGTAYFTGNQQMVQTVTYRMVWQCQYNYLGNYFFRLFENSCPQTIQVY